MATANTAKLNTRNILAVGSSPLMNPASLLPTAVETNHPPSISPTNRLGESLVTSESPMGESSSSPTVITT